MCWRLFLGLLLLTPWMNGCSLSRDIAADAGTERDSGVDAGTERDSGSADPDATPPKDAGPDGSLVDATTGTCPPECLARMVRWGRNGGLAFREESFLLEPCWSFRRIRRELGGPEEVTCEAELQLAEMSACAIANAVTPAFEHRDVQVAVAASPVVYGIDSRPVDGQVFRVEIDGAVVDVGSPCDPRRPPPLGGPCVPIPEGVAALVAALQAFQEQVVGAYCMP